MVTLRAALASLGVRGAPAYRTHGMRRGPCPGPPRGRSGLVRDPACGRLEVAALVSMHACGWVSRARGASSAAFRDYLHVDRLEAAAVMEAHFAASDEEPE